jgi:glycosyltransferase involved in cell wall biosynthesis
MRKNKIYVLVLITVMDRAGAETMMMNYLRNIDRNKIQMDFLINRQDRADYEDEIEQLGSRVYHMCPLYPGKFGRYKKEFRAFLKEHPEYKIIHSHLEERSCIALKIAKQMKVPVRIVHAHSVPKHFNIKKPVRLYFRHKLKGTYTHRFACSEAPAKWLYGTGECIELDEFLKTADEDGQPKENKTIIMRNAVDTKEFSFDERVRRKVRNELKIKGETLVIGHVGRFTYEKNQTFLIDIFHSVNKMHPDSRLVLIGGGKNREETEAKKEIKKKIKELGIDKKVKILGIRENIAELMQAMDILVMPSTSEGFPVTLVEAQSVGLRCLVSDAVSYKCNVTEEMQYMSLEEDAQTWANKIVSFYTENLNADKMNESVRTSGFDIKENSKLLEKFYENKLSKC